MKGHLARVGIVVGVLGYVAMVPTVRGVYMGQIVKVDIVSGLYVVLRRRV